MTDQTKTKPSTKRSRHLDRKPNTEPAATGTREANAEAESAVGTFHAPKPQSKASLVLELLQRPEGATLDQLVTATGWLQHTTRAALTGLKKKGHVIESVKPSDGPRLYRIIGKGSDVGAATGAAS